MSYAPIPPETPEDRARFDSKVTVTPEGCHDLEGFRRSKEYAGFQIKDRTYRAARVAYVWAYGEPNCDLHHTCENAWCVNPEHLTPSSAGQPRHRGASPNFCAHGHEFTPENTYVNPRGERQCRECLRAASRRYSERNREAVNAKKRKRRVRVHHDPRPCVVCGTLFTPRRAGATRGRYCPEPDPSDETAHKKWRDCMNERQRRNRLGRKENSDG